MQFCLQSFIVTYVYICSYVHTSYCGNHVFIVLIMHSVIRLGKLIT